MTLNSCSYPFVRNSSQSYSCNWLRFYHASSFNSSTLTTRLIWLSINLFLFHSLPNCHKWKTFYHLWWAPYYLGHLTLNGGFHWSPPVQRVSHDNLAEILCIRSYLSSMIEVWEGHCLTDSIWFQEQFFILKPGEVATRSFKVYPTTDQAAKYVCAGKSNSIIKKKDKKRQLSLWLLAWCVDILLFATVLCLVAAILKDSDFSEIDRAKCQFTTTATVPDNGTQVCLPDILVLKVFWIFFSWYIIQLVWIK